MNQFSLLAMLASVRLRARNDTGRPSGETERWKELDAASYDNVADEYDSFSRRLATPVAYRLVALASLREGERALDIGTGTGMIPFAMARTAPPSCSILGIDISAGMIEKAREGAAMQHLPPARVAFRQMDAEALELEDASFDVVTSAFALGHIPRPDCAIREMYRVLRPGGRLLITVGSRPSLLSFDAAEHAVAEVARRFKAMRGLRQGADLLERMVDRRLPALEEEPHGSSLATQQTRGAAIASLAHEAGFVRIAQSWRNYQNEVATADEFWRLHRTISTNPRKRLLRASPETVEAVREEFIATANRTLRRGGHLVYPISAAFVTAQKPSRPGRTTTRP